MGEKKIMKPHESSRIRKKSIRADSGDSWPVWNRGIRDNTSPRMTSSESVNDSISFFILSRKQTL